MRGAILGAVLTVAPAAGGAPIALRDDRAATGIALAGPDAAASRS